MTDTSRHMPDRGPVAATGDEQPPGHAIAIVGLAGRFPGSIDLDQFWTNLRDGVESVRFLSPEESARAGVNPAYLHHPAYVPAHATLDDIESFDAEFFRIPTRVAEIMDPQQRLFLECAWECLEHAGYVPERTTQRIGVYAGGSPSNYLDDNLLRNIDIVSSVGMVQLLLGNERDFLSTSVSYKLDLRGPSLTVLTACSTSLVAVHLACRALFERQCDMALAGGVSLQVPHARGYVHQVGLTSPDGHCRAFDAAANGLTRGSGAGLVALRRLEDALADGDTIHAVIRGSAVNNDGALKVGFSAPSVDGQRQVILDALSHAGADPDTITYIEAHGSGTPLGDPIEAAALGSVFVDSGNGAARCAIGSVKTNIGHLDAAAGVAGLIKTVLALRHRQIPPSLHFTTLNPEIEFESTRLEIAQSCTPWEATGGVRRAGVSSFGIGGTNAHVVVEEAPARTPQGATRPVQLLVLSARSSSALDRAARALANRLCEAPELPLADVAHTLRVGRRTFTHRLVAACETREEAAAALIDPARHTTIVCPQDVVARVAFCLGDDTTPAEGTGSGQAVRGDPRLTRIIDESAANLRRDTGYAWARSTADGGTGSQPKMNRLLGAFFHQHAAAQQFIAYGVQPHAFIARGGGELVAAALLGLFPVATAAGLAVVRAALSPEYHALGVLAVAGVRRDVERGAGSPTDDLLCLDSGATSLLAGELSRLEALQHVLAAAGIGTTWVRGAKPARYRDPRVETSLRAALPPMIAATTSTRLALGGSRVWLRAEQSLDAGFWVERLQASSTQAAALPTELDDSWRLLDLRPGRRYACRAPGLAGVEDHDAPRAAASCVERDFVDAIGACWLAGVEIDWTRFAAGERRSRVPLPTYPFERKRFWIDRQPTHREHAAVVPERARPAEATPASAIVATPAMEAATPPWPATVATNGHASIAEELELASTIRQMWEDLLGREIAVDESVFELGANSLMAVQVITRIKRMFPVELTVRAIFEAPTPHTQALVVAESLMKAMDSMTEEDMRQMLA
jgi:phthiocerol/phenolphthiocerol synthesis type-I polyketide synthase E